MNPFFFEIVRRRNHRYAWELVTYFGGDRRLIARSFRDWQTAAEATESATATQQAVCDAGIVPKPAQPGDIQFEVIEDVLALEVTGHGDLDGGYVDPDHDGYGDRDRRSLTTTARSTGSAETGSAGTGRAERSKTSAEAGKSNGEAAKSNGEARPKARPRKAPAKTTRAGASRN
ncbi:hypothetical protein [Paractinoplanes atraurantiacus]|uniref:Uncharacterized protein n=1 Tax=Paractinoplanes atraurantiacus TaxID=1036182 RepID=A0A285JZ87_9ACTN|nr:hypothetical protein [Actinoplanes atraurantiacus]SNY65087.1 hypothetical protein SAMN05421748_127130 [Actinoplanes atraurantiacus]